MTTFQTVLVYIYIYISSKLQIKAIYRNVKKKKMNARQSSRHRRSQDAVTTFNNRQTTNRIHTEIKQHGINLHARVVLKTTLGVQKHTHTQHTHTCHEITEYQGGGRLEKSLFDKVSANTLFLPRMTQVSVTKEDTQSMQATKSRPLPLEGPRKRRDWKNLYCVKRTYPSTD